MRLLDGCCGAGGMGVGFARAGFEVWGVDRRFRPAYPFPVLVHDILDVLADEQFLSRFDVLHVSPPCQEHTAMKHLYRAQGLNVKAHGGDMISSVRDLLVASGKPWIIENVEGSPLVDPVTVCGSSFGLAVRRHRLFESNMPLVGSECDHARQGTVVGVYGSPGDAVPGGGRIARTVGEAGSAMGIDWMAKWDDLKEAVPPVFAEFLGRQVRGLV